MTSDFIAGLIIGIVDQPTVEAAQSLKARAERSADAIGEGLTTGYVSPHLMVSTSRYRRFRRGSAFPPP
jgi:hypothetical protein